MPSNWARKEVHVWFEQSLDRKAMRLMGLVHRPEQLIQFADQLVHFRCLLNHPFDPDIHRQGADPKIRLRTSCGHA